jgi:hypothetical protein
VKEKPATLLPALQTPEQAQLQPRVAIVLPGDAAAKFQYPLLARQRMSLMPGQENSTSDWCLFHEKNPRKNVYLYLSRDSSEEMKLMPMPETANPAQDLFSSSVTFQKSQDFTVNITFVSQTAERLGPPTYNLFCAVFDKTKKLLTTAAGRMPGAGGSVTLSLGRLADASKAAYYQLGYFPKPPEEKDRTVIGGYLQLGMTGTQNLPDGVTITEPELIQSAFYKYYFVRTYVGAHASATTDYTAHLAAFDEKGKLLATAREKILGRVDLMLGVLPTQPVRYQLTVSQTPKDFDASFMVASTKNEPDGSLILMPKEKNVPIADALKDSKLRDYTQVKLTKEVVAALKEKGITDFVGQKINARGQSERSLYLCLPAIEVTTVIVMHPEDIIMFP